jgi:hypothetical protein
MDTRTIHIAFCTIHVVWPYFPSLRRLSSLQDPSVRTQVYVVVQRMIYVDPHICCVLFPFCSFHNGLGGACHLQGKNATAVVLTALNHMNLRQVCVPTGSRIDSLSQCISASDLLFVCSFISAKHSSWCCTWRLQVIFLNILYSVHLLSPVHYRLRYQQSRQGGVCDEHAILCWDHHKSLWNLWCWGCDVAW